MGNDILHTKEIIRNEENSLAKYVLVIMVKDVGTNLKFTPAHFASNGVTSDQLFPILWKFVEMWELDLRLNVLYITSDGASLYIRFICLYTTDQDSVVYRAESIYAEDNRFIYFISDAHLIKTNRNCFSNSTPKKCEKMEMAFRGCIK